MNTIVIGAVAANSADAWAGLWAKITAAAGVDKLVTLATWVGVGLIAWNIGKWMWTRRKGGGQASALGWPVAVGAILISPNVIIPSVLWIVDGVINIAVSIFS